MAKKTSVRFVCSNCGAISSTWSGRCFQCGQWNTLEEQLQTTVSAIKTGGQNLQAQTVTKVASHDDFKRLATGISEVDMVLGGGFVAGSVSLIAGQPGIGKSTLLLQLANEVAKQADVLYISGEESAHQVGLRALRLKANQTKLKVVTSNSADDIASTIALGAYKLVIIDSIQTISVARLPACL